MPPKLSIAMHVQTVQAPLSSAGQSMAQQHRQMDTRYWFDIQVAAVLINGHLTCCPLAFCTNRFLPLCLDHQTERSSNPSAANSIF